MSSISYKNKAEVEHWDQVTEELRRECVRELGVEARQVTPLVQCTGFLLADVNSGACLALEVWGRAVALNYLPFDMVKRLADDLQKLLDKVEGDGAVQ